MPFCEAGRRKNLLAFGTLRSARPLFENSWGNRAECRRAFLNFPISDVFFSSALDVWLPFFPEAASTAAPSQVRVEWKVFACQVPKLCSEIPNSSGEVKLSCVNSTVGTGP